MENKNQKQQVTIYTTPTCGYCKMAKQYFQDKKIEYKEIDVTTNEQATAEMVKKSGQNGVPVIEINGQIIIGFQQSVIDTALGL